ncbi:MAG TPA: hypothetical protein ENH84_07645 [Phycisphaerae bacterium]|nr:hypothetical protein [Phycisphaerae bacterium]
MSDIKRLGCCTLCDTPAYEVKRLHTKGPFKGHPAELGSPLETCRKVTFDLKGGTIITLTVCAECVKGLGRDKFDKIWAKCIAANHYENAAHPTTRPAVLKGREDIMKEMEADEILQVKEVTNHA